MYHRKNKKYVLYSLKRAKLFLSRIPRKCKYKRYAK